MRIIRSIKAFYDRYPYLRYIFVVIFGFIYFGLIQASSAFADPESFYHTKITVLMLKQGIIKDFPWLVYTVLTDIYIDHHFLYHVFLLPFVKFLPAFIGAKVATVFINTGFIVLFYGFMRSQKIKWPFFFVFLLLSSAPFIFRIDLVKASGFSLVFIMLILILMFQRKYIWLGIISFFYVWAYGGWPLSIILAGVFLFASFIANLLLNDYKWKKLLKKLEWRPLIATVLGSSAGLLINPYFSQNLKFYWIQTIQIALVNYKAKVGVGAEWYGFEATELITYGGGIFLVLFAGMLFFFGRIAIKKKININYKVIRNIFFFLICAGFFFVLTLKSRRNTEYSFPFLVMTAAFIFKYFWDKDVYQWLKKNFLKIFKWEILYKVFLAYLGVMLVIAFGANFWRIKTGLAEGTPFDKYKIAMEVVKNNTEPGEIIFHSDWDDWPMLFYHNIYNRYIVGLDATFMYKYNVELYEKWRDITWGDYVEDPY
ncbi:hypothetical protein ACFL29_01685, partial [Patescibacteria group bacterium]